MKSVLDIISSTFIFSLLSLVLLLCLPLLFVKVEVRLEPVIQIHIKLIFYVGHNFIDFAIYF